MATDEADFLAKRRHLVEDYLKPQGITDERVLATFLTVPRHAFVPPGLWEEAYDDVPLPIGEEQVITQPSLAARMTQALHLAGDEKVLEVGTGSGYQAAILSLLAREVHTLERHTSLANRAEATLRRLGYDNVSVYLSDGTLGLAQEAPFDAIIVTAGGTRIPEPLIEQLKEGGRLVIPIGPGGLAGHELKAGRKIEAQLALEDLGPARFVPLVGKRA